MPPKTAQAASPASCATVAAATSVHLDHHLWLNCGVWWAAFTIHLPPFRKRRVRCSLKTRDVAVARRQRDRLFQEYTATEGISLSLRFDGPRRRVHGGQIPASRCA